MASRLTIKSADKINSWVKDHTDGKIDKMVDKVDSNTMMYLINALYFEAGWKTPYFHSNKGKFQTGTGFTAADFMDSSDLYIHDEKSDGMLKYFKDKRYAFAGILPKEGTSVDNYINQMSGAGFLKLINSEGDETADCRLPKFKYDYTADLNSPLKLLGLTDGFDSKLADFSKMGTSANGKLLYQ